MAGTNMGGDKTCKTCKYWDNSPIWNWVRDEPSVTKMVQKVSVNARRWDCHTEGQELGECGKSFGSNTEKSFGSGDNSGPMMAAVAGSEGIYGELITDAKFCCMLYGPRESENG